MSRKRWIYPKGGEPYEVGDDYVQPIDKTAGDSVLWNDRAYQDMRDPRFQSRAQHRAYMKRMNLTTADDFKGTWANAAKDRERISRGEDRERREQIARAMHKRG